MTDFTPLLVLLCALVTGPTSTPPAPSDDTSASVAPTSSAVLDSAAQKAAPPPSLTVSIDSLCVTDMKLYDTLDVMLTAVNVEPAGFSLKVATESGMVDIIEILPGEIIDSCRWDLFNARQVPSEEPSVGPAAVWQIVALAEQVSGAKRPICYGLKRPASLARLVVSSAHMAEVPDTTVGIFFYWESCRDNVVSDRQGSSILISDSVANRLPVRWAAQHAAFPTREGTPDECVSDRAANRPRRAVSFENGGVVFKYELPSSIDSAGPLH